VSGEQSPLPSRHAVRTLIEDLVGRDIDLKDGQPVPGKTTNVVAVFVTDRLATSAVAVTDLEGAARLGGALGLVPKAGVEDAIKERELSQTLKDNCYEVMNVLSAAFNVPGAPHVRLYQMYGPNEAVPNDIASVVGLVGSRMDIVLEVAGYGSVPLSIVCR
jgi:hypothetical protein